MRLICFFLLGISLIVFANSKASHLIGQQPKQNVKKGQPSTPPPDGEFTKFGIYEATAPRAKPTTPIKTEWPLKLNQGDRIALIGNALFERAQDYG